VATETPVLLLGYNRPHQMRGLIQSLSPLKPKLILLSVDGPRMNRLKDVELVRQTQEMVNEITWNAEIRTRFRESNLGLRRAVVDSVTWANSEYGRVIVLEDDVRAGPQLLEFLNHNLDEHLGNHEIAHINGYNLAPKKQLTHPNDGSRLSIYPESFAWATWDRAWKEYDDDLTWAKNASINDIRRVCGSSIGALRWKQNFADAAAERIDTWAYRWLASMWEQNWKMISPNRNLSSYHGHSDGTHTRISAKFNELEIERINCVHDHPSYDQIADHFIGRSIMGETYWKLIRGIAISALLQMSKYRDLR
jgi:hypothetical protein